MENENLALKYKKTAKKVSFFVMIFIIAVGAIILGFGLFIAIYYKTGLLIGVGSVMSVVGLFDILLGIRFNKATLKRIDKIKDSEAIERYKRIHGIK